MTNENCRTCHNPSCNVRGGDFGPCNEYIPKEPEPLAPKDDDLISRSALLTALNETKLYKLSGQFEKLIRHAPAADPQKHGHWIWDANGMDWNLGAWRCGKCGGRNANLPGAENINPYLFAGSQFCPSCGASMDAADEAGKDET